MLNAYLHPKKGCAVEMECPFQSSFSQELFTAIGFLCIFSEFLKAHTSIDVSYFPKKSGGGAVCERQDSHYPHCFASGFLPSEPCGQEPILHSLEDNLGTEDTVGFI